MFKPKSLWKHQIKNTFMKMNNYLISNFKNFSCLCNKKSNLALNSDSLDCTD